MEILIFNTPVNIIPLCLLLIVGNVCGMLYAIKCRVIIAVCISVVGIFLPTYGIFWIIFKGG